MSAFSGVSVLICCKPYVSYEAETICVLSDVCAACALYASQTW